MRADNKNKYFFFLYKRWTWERLKLINIFRKNYLRYRCYRSKLNSGHNHFNLVWFLLLTLIIHNQWISRVQRQMNLILTCNIDTGQVLMNWSTGIGNSQYYMTYCGPVNYPLWSNITVTSCCHLTIHSHT